LCQDQPGPMGEALSVKAKALGLALKNMTK